MTVRLVHDGRDELGEGPHWCTRERCLLRVDILGQAIHRLDEHGKPGTSTLLGAPVGVAVPRRAGGLLAAIDSSVCIVHEGGERQTLVRPEVDRPGNRFNDGKCDARGRFWVGSLAIDGTPGAGALWRVNPDGRATRMIDGVDIANGLGWSPDNTRFYFTDSGKATIHEYAFDLDAGELGERRTFAQLQAGGVPDGLAVDEQGFIWSAIWDGARVLRFDPDGAIERTVTLPVPRPTSCAFGGTSGRTLYITSARAGLSAEALAQAPHSGGVFALEAPVAGLPETVFG